MRVAIVGAGWAGLSCAIEATQRGHSVTLYEAARHLGGRARAVPLSGAAGDLQPLDNGQHILIGAYHDTLAILQTVGLNQRDVLLRCPLVLKFPDQTGLQFGNWPPPLDALAGILGAGGWSWRDKFSLLRVTLGWRMAGFTCPASTTVAQLCIGLTERIINDMIMPLCVSALNTPADRASGQVFLRVMKDALFGGQGSSNLLLPLTDLSSLFPAAAGRWLQERGAVINMGYRVREIRPDANAGARPWSIDGTGFDALVLAMDSANAASAVEFIASASAAEHRPLKHWFDLANAIQYEAITTVYARTRVANLRWPMMALKSDDGENPAQFVFDRGQLGGPAGLLAFVISASTLDRLACQALVVQQARRQLDLAIEPLQTIVEKRATFACTPDLQRPPMLVATHLLACGDYIEGPYPATLEGAVRSGLNAARALSAH